MNQVAGIIEKFGGATRLSKLLGHKHPSTVHSWKRRGRIPWAQQQRILDKARETGIEISEADFFRNPKFASSYTRVFEGS